MRNRFALALLMTSSMAISGCAHDILRNGVAQDDHLIENYSQKVVLENILRARNREPLSYSDLSSITDAASSQGSVGLSDPFGKLHGASAYNSITPSITASSSPTANIASLNSQGFIITMMQPISPQYIVSKWHSGYDQRELLQLFVKSIRFSDEKLYVNDPKNIDISASGNDAKISREKRTGFDQFNQVIATLTGQNFQLKSLTLAEPVGPAFALVKTITTKQTPNAVAGDKTVNETDTNYSDLTAFTLASSLNDGQFHLGNQACDKVSAPTGSPLPYDKASVTCGQIYRITPSQVALCVPTKHRKIVSDRDDKNEEMEELYLEPLAVDGSLIKDLIVSRKYAAKQINNQAHLPEKTITPSELLDMKISLSALALSQVASVSGGGGSKSGGSGGGGVSGGGASGGSGGGSGGGGGGSQGGMTQISQTLSVSRISAIIPAVACYKDELVHKAETEVTYADSTAYFTHLEWRSVTDLIDFLGEISEKQLDVSKDHVFIIFEVGQNEKMSDYAITVKYHGKVYGIKRGDTLSLDALRLTKELVDASKISSGTSVPQPVIFVP